MKRHYIYAIIAVAMGATAVSCSDDATELTRKEILEPSYYPDSIAADSVDKALFDVIDLTYPGLEKVKAQYEAGHYYNAAYELLNYYRTRSNVMNPNINLMNPTLSPTERNVADQALEHRFYIRNFKEKVANGQEVYYSFDKDGKIDWETLAGTMADQEFRNQLHRHQWMPAQAKAYRATGNEAYFTSWKKTYTDWMKAYANPKAAQGSDPVVWGGLQPAERVRDRMNFLPYFIQSAQFTPGWLSTVLKATADEVETIRQGYYREGSNIRLTQARVVATAGVLLPEFKNAGQWLKEGLDGVSAELDNQFNADGVQNELDPSYHIAAISDFYDLYQLMQLNQQLDKVPSEYISKMKSATQFVADIIFPNYSIDNFNDTRNSSYTKSVILKNLRRYADMFPEDAEMQWLASEGRRGQAPRRLMSEYAVSGYYMMRNGWTPQSTMMIVKNNANPDNRWHCQPDNGTFSLYRNGRNFFPDAGTYSYGGNKQSNAERNYYRATKMHNTLTVLGKTIDGKHMNGKLLKSEQQGNTQLLVTQNQSYAAVTHRRAVFFVEGRFFVIVDEAFGDGNKDKVNLNFHLATGSGAEATVIDDFSDQFAFGAHTNFADNNNMLIRTFAETHQDFGATRVETNFSSKLGEVNGKRIGYQYNIRKPEQGAARMISVIYPYEKATDFENIKIGARFTDNPTGKEGTFHAKGAAAEVTINGKVYKISFTL